VCKSDPLLRKVCCLPGAWVNDVKRKLPTLVQCSDYYPLFIFQVGSGEVATSSPRAIKRDFRALGQLVKVSGAQAVLSSIFPVAGNDERRDRRASRSIPGSKPGVTGRILGVFIMGQFT